MEDALADNIEQLNCSVCNVILYKNKMECSHCNDCCPKVFYGDYKTLVCEEELEFQIYQENERCDKDWEEGDVKLEYCKKCSIYYDAVSRGAFLGFDKGEHEHLK